MFNISIHRCCELISLKELWPRIIYYFRYNTYSIYSLRQMYLCMQQIEEKKNISGNRGKKWWQGKKMILLWVLPLLLVHCFAQPGKTLPLQFSSLCVLTRWSDVWTTGKPGPTHKQKRRLQTARRPSETPAGRQTSWTTLGVWKSVFKRTYLLPVILLVKRWKKKKRGGNNCCLMRHTRTSRCAWMEWWYKQHHIELVPFISHTEMNYTAGLDCVGISTSL